MLLLVFMVGSISEVIKYMKYTGTQLNSDMVKAAFTICWDGIKQ
jgi:hypothetical protein